MTNEVEKLSEVNPIYALVVPIQTYLKFEDAKERLVEFENRQFTWVNGDEKFLPKIIIPIASQTLVPPAFDYDWKNSAELGVVSRFLTMLASKHHIPIAIYQHHRYIVFVGSDIDPMPRTPAEFIGRLDEFSNQPHGSKLCQLALALYREGINSSSVFYAFLNYYKIIELAFSHFKREERSLKSREWIKANFDQAIKEWPWVWPSIKLREKPLDEGEYLYKICRCAIAHASLEGMRNPDDPKDYYDIHINVEIMRALAVLMINHDDWNRGGPDEPADQVME